MCQDTTYNNSFNLESEAWDMFGSGKQKNKIVMEKQRILFLLLKLSGEFLCSASWLVKTEIHFTPENFPLEGAEV
jgi:hypothetical protein